MLREEVKLQVQQFKDSFSKEKELEEQQFLQRKQEVLHTQVRVFEHYSSISIKVQELKLLEFLLQLLMGAIWLKLVSYL